MNNLPRAAISPLPVAEKQLAAARKEQPGFAEQIRRQPRLPELQWALVWHSRQPGGLEEHALEVIQEFHDQFGPPCLFGQTDYISLEQREEIWSCIKEYVGESLIPVASWKTPANDKEDTFESWQSSYPKPREPSEVRRFQSALCNITAAQFRAVFLDAAKEHLPGRLRCICLGEAENEGLCWRPDDLGAINLTPWWCEHLMDVLLASLDSRARRIEARLARTQVVASIFERLEYAWEKKVFIQIEGTSRVGKSDAIIAKCEAYPGRFCLVSTPSGKSMADLFKAIADALGLPYGPRTNGGQLKQEIQFIIRHSGLFFILDEAHFLLPTSFDRNTTPARLDWVRTQIVDKKLPVAIVATPQAMTHARNKFEKHTGYNFAQFFGRVALPLILEDSLTLEDMLAVVKIHANGIPQELWKDIAAAACLHVGYLNTVESICKYAGHLARRNNRATITKEDVATAIAQVTGTAPEPVKQEGPRAVRQQPIAVKRGRATAPLVPRVPASPLAALEGPARQTTPAPALEMAARETTPSQP